MGRRRVATTCTPTTTSSRGRHTSGRMWTMSRTTSDVSSSSRAVWTPFYGKDDFRPLLRGGEARGKGLGSGGTWRKGGGVGARRHLSDTAGGKGLCPRLTDVQKRGQTGVITGPSRLCRYRSTVLVRVLVPGPEAPKGVEWTCGRTRDRGSGVGWCAEGLDTVRRERSPTARRYRHPNPRSGLRWVPTLCGLSSTGLPTTVDIHRYGRMGAPHPLYGVLRTGRACQDRVGRVSTCGRSR